MQTDVLILIGFTALIGLYCGIIIHTSIKEANARHQRTKDLVDMLDKLQEIDEKHQERAREMRAIAKRESIQADIDEDNKIDANSF